MEFTVEYAEVINEKMQTPVRESYHLRESRREPFVWKSEILKFIKSSHPNIKALVIKDCNVRVWNDD